MESLKATPLPVIANVSRVVTKVVDRITGSRVDYPLLVANAAVEALKRFRIGANTIYGPAAWVEVTEDNQPYWAGCWDGNVHIWAATEFGEVVDLNASVAHSKHAHRGAELRPRYSPPMLWSAEVPAFYRYHPEGVAEVELTEERDRRWFNLVMEEVTEKCSPDAVKTEEDDLAGEFANEAILCPGRRLLDDSENGFRHYDRALSVKGIPEAPPVFSSH